MGFHGKSLLVVMPDFPYPPNHGGRLDMWGRLRAFHKLGFTIDLVATVKTEPEPAHVAKVRELVNDLVLLPRSRKVTDLLSLKPFQVTSRACLGHLPRKRDYDLVFLEMDYVAPVLDAEIIGKSPVILKMHNDEVVYSREIARASKGLGLKLFHWAEAAKFALLQRVLAKRVPSIFFCSDSECAAFAKRYPKVHCRYLGGATADDAIHIRPRQGRGVLFIGSLFMANNCEAVDWYLAEVHPKLLDVEGYTFTIVGNAKGADEAWLAKLEATPRVAVHRSVPDLEPYYEAAAVFVNPMQHGAGIKMKTIEALRNGLPIVSSPAGVSGGDFRSGDVLLVAQNSEEFAAEVRRLLEDRSFADRLVQNGFDLINREYDHAALLKRLLDEIGL